MYCQYQSDNAFAFDKNIAEVSQKEVTPKSKETER